MAGLRIARLLGDRLWRSRPLARVGCLDYTASSPRNRDEVRVKLHFEGPWMWPHGQAYHVVFPVTADDPAAQAEAMYDAITASDPRGRLIHTGVPDQTEYLRAWESAR